MSIYNKYPRLLDVMFVEAYDLSASWTAADRHNNYNDEDVAVSIIRNKGNYAAVARDLNRSRRSVQNYILQNILLRELRDDIVSTVLDDIEERYMEDALAGDGTARRFFLQTLGKDRGYVVRSENTGENGTPLYKESRVNVTALSDEALMELMKAGKSNG